MNTNNIVCARGFIAVSTLILVNLILCGRAPAQGAQTPAGDLPFERVRLSGEFYGEGATFGDLNRDGKMDIISGPYWYEGPDWKSRHELYEPKVFDPAGYSDNFFVWIRDFDGDGWPDILMVGFPGKEAFWFRNPAGSAENVAKKRWERNLAWHNVDNESPAFTDLTGDGREELICSSGGQFGWCAPDIKNPAAKWTFHPIYKNQNLHTFTHGLGVGDVNGDGRKDILWKDGWYEQPASLAGDPEWVFHKFTFSDREGGAQMYTFDVDGDGDADVITSLAAHHFGLSWFEQTGKSKEGDISFLEHRLMDDKITDNPAGVRFGEVHAVDFADMNGDGQPDIICGKRWWSHGAQGDPEPGSKPVVYWFELIRKNGKADFIPHPVDDGSGVGVQLVTGDVNGDGARDVVIGNKLGTFVLLQKKRDDTVVPGWGNGIGTTDPTLDFETGDLRGWTATGNAFTGQPVEGDTVSARGREASLHQGKFWIGGFEKTGDDAKGTLTSDPIVVNGNWASFLVGGGGWNETRVEILDDAGKVIFKTTGANFESMQRVAVDLRGQTGRKIQIRLVDDRKGHWGHLNFDDFQFHTEKPAITRPKGVPAILMVDDVPNAGLKPADALAAMTTRPGFQVELIASEPELVQPEAFTLDYKNRLWVVEGNTYPVRAPGEVGSDNIIVLEDRDGDGKYETKTVFKEKLNLVSGIAVGYGGVWVGAAPYLLFIPDRDDNLIPDSAPEILLDGFGYQDTHETLNAFNWGPDGWLYGCHGVFTHSLVGKPGTPKEQRTPMNAAIWRFHPQRREFEVFAWGTSNPWGVDFNDMGQAFATACVVPHLWHVIQGARYERQAGAHFDPYVFNDIKTIADHLHWLGDDQWAANMRSNSAGGGHAHAGAMVYLGDSFPAADRNQIFFSNIHGNRINNDLLERAGSGYVGKHGQDLLLANDRWFRGINLKYGPEGSVYLIDWYDKQACHWTDPKIWDRGNGRLYRVSFGAHHAKKINIHELSNMELVALQSHANDWYVREARRTLAERAATLERPAVPNALLELLRKSEKQETQLRALWALHGIGEFNETIARELLQNKGEYVRAWAIQLAAEDRSLEPETLLQFEQLAKKDPSPVVRLYLASALQRLPLNSRWGIAAALASHGEDSADHNIPLMLWYGIEPLVAADAPRALDVFLNSQIEMVARFVARRAAAEAATRTALVGRIAKVSGAPARPMMLEELYEGVKDQRKLARPAGWAALAEELKLSGDEHIQKLAHEISVKFGAVGPVAVLKAAVADPAHEITDRMASLEEIINNKDPQAGEIVTALIGRQDPLRGAAIRLLAVLESADAARAVIGAYGKLNDDEKRDALNTLSSRVSYANILLDAVEGRAIASTDIGAFVARKLDGLKNSNITDRVRKLWGDVREISKDKLARIAELKLQLTQAGGAAPNVARGREIFSRTCQQCHTLFGTGGKVGPELTGSNRANLDYLLSNVMDPNAVIGKDYLATIVWMKDGRLVTGIQKSSTESSITLQTENEQIVVARADIDDTKLSDVSTMPEGLIDRMPFDQVRDLITYLQSPAQTPILATPANANRFFNSKDLTGWRGMKGLWSVENGEIVGKTAGLPRNEFLVSEMLLSNFKLTFEIRLVANEGNSGVQFRSQPRDDGEMTGYQADIGAGWWGKLYEENGRALLWDKPADSFVKNDGWNVYEIEARGSVIKTSLNGNPCVNLTDPDGAKSGVTGLQVHSGGATEVRFRNFKLEVYE